MNVNWVKSESTVKPLELDEKSSQSGVYLRKNIVFENDKYTYDEAYLSKEDYNRYLICVAVNDIDTSEAATNYAKKLDTAVEYTNEKMYKPKWAESVYAELLQKGSLLPAIFPMKIYDATELEANAVIMTMQELIALTVFLASKQEQYFQEYKAEKTGG